MDPGDLCGNYEITGFPAALSETQRNDTTIHLIIYNTMPGKHANLATDDLLLDYAQSAYAQSATTDRGLTTMPNPHGISGGGVWYIPRSLSE
jgi:hypothetical protein